eukprot:TRINITY_DN23297_c0_g7_i1.p1 TRINITY_DN23297_c0_g7~~TRINITY_DN23297_c0_g7_i1.p1  ORF type:complete len:596 (+),score=103.87 TRINITY_DN23297_c0_g7_i1:3-1790(+)
MKAINTNSGKALRKALSCAPRGKRAMWMLNITVGTQSISPLYWSIESGSLECAKAMLADLLIIRADRDNYYYGCDDLFERHPDVVKRLCADAEGLVPTLLDGLIWRSRVTSNGFRRVNYYIKHMLVDADGKLSKNLEWLVDNEDPKIVCHPVVVLFSDLLWSRIASRYFLWGRCWFLFTLAVFITSQSILQHLNKGNQSEAQRIMIFVCRIFIYLGSLGSLLRRQLRSFFKDLRRRRFMKIGGFPVPEYLRDWKESVTFVLVIVLIVMLCMEPIFHCLSDSEVSKTEQVQARLLQAATPTTTTVTKIIKESQLFTQDCEKGKSLKKEYSTASMIAMMCYWSLVTDLSILSTRISAFVLVCGRVISEVMLFLFAVAFLVINFASSIKALNTLNEDFDTIGDGCLTLVEIALDMFPMSNYEAITKEGLLFTAVGTFIVIAIIFLMSLLVAQLNGAYQQVFNDMVGYARLNRGKVICYTMAGVSAKHWERFLRQMKFDDRLEFNEGDIGLAGGYQVLELANVNPTTVDMIRRFGGSTAKESMWPEDENAMVEEEDKLEKLEKTIIRTTKTMTTGGGGGAKKKGGGGDSEDASSADSDE